MFDIVVDKKSTFVRKFINDHFPCEFVFLCIYVHMCVCVCVYVGMWVCGRVCIPSVIMCIYTYTKDRSNGAFVVGL